jgi:hypothetical protein
VEARLAEIQLQLLSSPSDVTLLLQLSQARCHLQQVRANGRYLALLSVCAMLVLVVSMLLLGWELPIVRLSNVVNRMRADKIARLGLTEGDVAREPNEFAAAFDWLSWLWTTRT